MYAIEIRSKGMDESNQTIEARASSHYTEYDVLCGRGKSLDSHSGNCAFRVLMRNQSELYENVTRQEKGRILSVLAAGMKAKGVRFLKKDSIGVWQELDAADTKLKVSSLYLSFEQQEATATLISGIGSQFFSTS